jgi:hypothetical protein
MSDFRDNDPLPEGLMTFYSSQATLLLEQYENINHLLGPTRDWSHPGSHCEILLRDFLRQNLLRWMSVDKGYIYGRTQRGQNDSHCPEIDILIHDTQDYTPIFRMGDFVIVQPEAVLGIIQVKRTFSLVGKENPLEVGLRQAVGARQHCFDMLIASKPSNVSEKITESDLIHPVFSAVAAFEESEGVSLEDALKNRYTIHLRERHHPQARLTTELSLAMMPTFVGSLKGRCAYAMKKNNHKQLYRLYDSFVDKRNVCLQLLLFAVLHCIRGSDTVAKKPFAFPKILAPVPTFSLEPPVVSDPH